MNNNKSLGMMLNMVMGDRDIVSQLLDAGALSDSEMRDLSMRISDRLGRNNVRPERLLAGLRNVRVAS
jgi:hypothetical protein